MCTIIKVKRKITDDPVDCLIIECKKKKFLNESLPESEENTRATTTLAKEENKSDKFEFKSNRIDSIKQILKYAGSAKSENEISAKLIEISSKYKHSNRQKDVKTLVTSSQQATKTNESKRELKTNRYVLLNKKRGIENTAPTNDSTESVTQPKLVHLKNINIIDVISSEYVNQDETHQAASTSTTTTTSATSQTKTERVTCNGVEMIREKSSPSSKKQIEYDTKTNEYVYDIYYARNMDIHLDLLYPNNFEIKSGVYDEKIELLDENGEDEAGEDPYEDDEDSNDEGNWRNDYPDEDDDDDIDNEEDDDEKIYSRRNAGGGSYKYNDEDYDDNYNEYGYGDEDDEELTYYMKKSCNLDRSYYEDESENEDDFDEYDNETVSKSYCAYKRKLIRDMNK